MKQPGTLVRHADREYLLVEGGYNDESRAVVLLARPGDPDFPHDPAVEPIAWGHQGRWTPVARWTREELRIPDAKHGERRAQVRTILDEYLGRARAPLAIAWTARRKGGFAGSFEAALPMGVAVVCHDDREAAAAVEGVEELVPIENLAMFFTHLVREGYAGVMWNAERPVFFCVDELGDLQFLRVGPAVEGARVELEILDAHNAWEGYDGAEEIEFIDNREACDRRLVDVLGPKPVLGWPEGGPLWSVGPRAGFPIVVREGEGDDDVPHGVLFTEERLATAFRDDVSPELAVFAVNDLGAFLTHTELQGCVTALNQGGHRASSGILWSDGERIVLDSFSGFWALGEAGFEPIE